MTQEGETYGGPPRNLLKFKRLSPDTPSEYSSMGIISESPASHADETPASHQLRDSNLIIKDANWQGGFAQVPSVVVRDPRLSANAVRLYCLLLSYAWSNQQCFPGQQRLADDMGCDRRTIIRTFAELNEQCLISWKRRGLGKTNIYYIERLSDGYLKHHPLIEGI